MLTWKVKIVLINKRLWKSEMEMKGYGGVIVMSRTTASTRMVEVASYAKVG